MKRIMSILLTVMFALCFSSCAFMDIYKIHSTTDIAKYGDFPTTKYGYGIKPYTDNILPPTIEDFYATPEYYFAYCDDPYMHEVYLEVTIEDKEKYTKYKAELLAEKETEPFFYNDDYQEYVLTDVLYVEDNTYLTKSEVQKMLFNDEQNEIVFISLLILHRDYNFAIEDFVYFKKLGVTEVWNYYGGARLWQYKVNELPYLY